MKQKFVALLLALIITIVGIPTVLSVSDYVTRLQSVYGSGSCDTCHVDPSGGGSLNAYGKLFENQPNHLADPVSALVAIGSPPGVASPTPSPSPVPTQPVPSPVPTQPVPSPVPTQQISSNTFPIVQCYLISQSGKVISPTVGPTTSPTVGPTVGPTTSPTVGPTVGPIGGHKEVQGFYSLWASQSDWSNLRLDLISTLVIFGMKINADGGFDTNAEQNIPDQLITQAHNSGVKVVFLFGTTYDDTATTDSIIGSYKDSSINNILSIIQKHNLDGVDLDIEGTSTTNSITGTSNKILMTNFVSDLRTKLNTVNPNYRISIDIGGYYPDVDNFFDINVLQNYVNYIMLMGYDYHYSNGPTAGPIGPINDYNTWYSVTDSINHYTSLMSKNKFLLGVPWYGYEWPTQSGSVESPTTGVGTYYPYQTMKDRSTQHGRIWDDTWKTPWYKYQSGNQWYQGHYDDIESLGIKYDLVGSTNIAGIGIWELEYGDSIPELWQLMQDKFGKR